MPDEVAIEVAHIPVADAAYTHPHTNVCTIWTGSAIHIFVVFSDATALRISRSTNGGISWTDSTLQATTGLVGYSVWYDRWTPGDTTGNILHVAASNPATETLIYFSWNLSTHTVGGTTNVVGITTLGISGAAASGDGGTSICKGANGSLYMAVKSTTTAPGWDVVQSINGGTSWATITAQGSSVKTNLGQVDDNLVLVPCSLTDDIMAIEYDDSATALEYQIYDDSANTWGAPVTIDTTVENLGIAEQSPSNFNATVDKTTSDIYLVYFKANAGGSLVGDVLFRKFTVSAGTWGNPRNISNNPVTAAEGTNLWEGTTCCIERDQTNGILMVYYMLGNVASDMTLYMKWSSDDGDTWSSPFKPNITVDDHRKLACPLVMNSVNEGWYCIWVNDDTDDVMGLRARPYDTANGTVLFSTLEGNVKDNSGTNVEGAEVIVIRHETDERGQGGHGGAYASQGKGNTDASGNYKVHVMDFMGSMNKYQALIRYDRADKEIFKDAAGTQTMAVGTLYASKIIGLTNGDTMVGAVIRSSVDTLANMRLKAYADSSGSPGALLGESGSVATQGFIRSIKFTTPFSVPSDGIVWIAWETQTAITSGIRAETGLASGTTKTVTHTFGAGPDPFGSPTNQTYGLWGNTFGLPMVDATIAELKN